jgi:transcriptional regulator with XRE-family HTH domain
MKASLGQKIKYFRKRAQLSQFELEIKAGLSSGVISRIEHSQINPTKETLMNLSNILDLNREETIYLLSPDKLSISDQEFEKILPHIQQDFEDDNTIMYLLDNFRRVRLASKRMLNLFGLSEAEANKVLGHHILEFIFDPKLPCRKMLDLESLAKVGLICSYSFQSELGFLIDNGEFDHVLYRLNQLPNFKEIWDKAKKLSIDLHSNEYRNFNLRVGNKKQKFVFSSFPIEYDRRLEIIEFLSLI